MRKILVAVLLLAAGACSQGSGVSRVPELYVTVTGDVFRSGTVVSDEPVYFSESDAGGKADFTVGNLGDWVLTVKKITVVKKNANMTVKKLDTINFTHECDTGLCAGLAIAPGDTTTGTAADFQVVFHPGATQDDSETLITIETDDDLLPNGVFNLRIAPPQKAPALKVSPNNYIFLDATASKPQTADFTVSNEGNARLAIGDVRFEAPTNAFNLLAKPNKDTPIDPSGTGGAGNVTLRVSYKPVTPPEAANLQILWGAVIDSGVACSGTDADKICRTNADLCPAGKTCPYTCGNGKCQCTSDDDCKAALCSDASTCSVLCLTGVCREPTITTIRLQGESQPGKLEIQYADQVGKCVDFQDIVQPGQTCTKVVKLVNQGPGQVTVARPQVAVGGGASASAYSVQLFKVGGSHGGGDEVCGAWQGTEITDNTVILGALMSVDVAVTYQGGATGVNGELVVKYQTPQDVETRVPLCGGQPKGVIDVAPSATATLGFDAGAGQTQTHTLVILNRGNGPLTIKSLGIVKANPDLDPDAFSILSTFTGGDVPAGGLVPIEVKFSGDFEGVALDAWLDILYVDPTASTPTDEHVQVHLLGRNDFCLPEQTCVQLPKANAGTAEDYKNAKVGSTVVLDGSKSAQSAGTYPLSDLNGYSWFVTARPAASKAFPMSSYAGPQLAFVPDAAGEWTFRLWVQTGSGGVQYYSDESQVTVTVAP